MKKIFVFLGLMAQLCFAAAPLPKQSLIVGNNTINYYKVGQGTPIVMLMGYGLTNNFWPRSFINCLAKEHTLYILDYIKVDKPSLDLMAELVNNFILEANLDHPEVIGWSMGGGIAMSLANKYPHSISKIGLISSVIADPSVSQMVAPYQVVNNSTDEKLNYVFGNNLYQYNIKKLPRYKADILNKNAALFPKQDILKLQNDALSAWMLEPENYTMLSRLRTPADIVIADHDKILNPQVQLHAFKKYSKANISIIENAGHASFYQYPDSVCKAVLE